MKGGSLFPAQERQAPLADRMRPRRIEEVVGQGALLGEEGPVRRMVESGKILPHLYWGPPGCGKTTIARLLAQAVDAHFLPMSAVMVGVKEIREAVIQARKDGENGRRTLLFLDEIHRFNRSQQDALLPHVEDGTFILVGATTENPSFTLNRALLSRLTVFVLTPLDLDELTALLARALHDEPQGYGALKLTVEGGLIERLAKLSHGDARYALGLLEAVVEGRKEDHLKWEAARPLVRARAAAYDRDRDQHYDLISALHKAMRGSDPDAMLYWLHRMIEGGEDPLYIARRMIRMASEDVGLADPQALPQAIAAYQTFEMLGAPEGILALSQAAVYLATAPKSNALYMAEKAARKSAKEHADGEVPPHIRNAPTQLMKELGYGKQYLYPHDFPHAFVPQEYFPVGMFERYYRPTDRGFEKVIDQRIKWWDEQRRGSRTQKEE
ncbi:MAG: AAA family ATPase [Alphaproteobacteria bacterium CG_4_10_14_0_2_um_filter_63_37]|nr:MAG: hypothetical protein AUJ55_01915 [Proteobacteria bacterium CG1_02_64_396]PJA23448.1 MAG: AAA family ATPase [Alphaproteobacteria bacterium CG_4_10_14_0_2_um_filter_63_37]